MAMSKSDMEQKALTKKERIFVERIVNEGLDRMESYSLTWSTALPAEDTEAYEKLKSKVTRMFYKPHIRCYYDALMEDVRAGELLKARWTKEVATEKLMNLVDKAEQELEQGNVTMARLSAIQGSIKELNTMHGLNAPTKVDMEHSGFVLNIIDDGVPD